MKNGEVRRLKHMCHTCKFSFPECSYGVIVWGIDLNKKVSSFEADKVVACENYQPRPLPEKE